jgi:hypothetical protein
MDSTKTHMLILNGVQYKNSTEIYGHYRRQNNLEDGEIC